MSKELKALERIKYKLSSTKANGYWEDLDTIETALEDYENLKILNENQRHNIELLMEENKTLKQMIRNFNEAIGEPQMIPPNVEKKLKALEIIKEKMADVQLLDRGYITCVFDYNNQYDDKKYHLTQEEYELLKEVLYGTHQ